MDPSIWLQLETKVRVLIKDLIEPTVRRAAETVKKVDAITNYQQNLIYKLEDVEALVANIEKRLVVIDEFSNKITEFEGNVNVMEARIKKDREELRSDLLTFTKNQESFGENLDVLNRQKDMLKDEIVSTNNVILLNKYELETKIGQASQKFKDAVFVFNSKFVTFEASIDQNSKSIDQVANNIPKLESVVNEVQRSTTENKERIKKLRNKEEKNFIYLSREIDKVRNIAMTNKSDILANKKEIKRIDELISSDESAICNEVNLTDPLYSVFSDLPTLKLVSEYDLKRLEKIVPSNYSLFVQQNIMKLKQKAKELIDRPLPIVKKDSNVTTSSKKKKRKEKLRSFKKKLAQSITKTYKNPNDITRAFSPSASLSKGLELSADHNEALDTLSGPFNTDVPEKQLISVDMKTNFGNPGKIYKLDQQKPAEKPVQERKLSVVINEAINNAQSISSGNSDSDSSELFIDFTPMIENVKIQLQSEAQQLYSDLKSQIANSTSMLTSQISNCKSELIQTILSIKSDHENYTASMDKKLTEIELHIQQAIYECNSASTQRKRDHVDYGNQFKFVKTGFEEITSQHTLLHEKLDTLNKILTGLIEFGRISLALQGQDENDRESIFLMGSKTSKKNRVVSIDKRCLSCAGQSSSVISAFKIACLAYEPSPVTFQDRKFTRKNLLRVQKKMLESFEKGNTLDLSDEFRDVDRVVITSGQWRPLSVPVSRFTTLTSPHLRTPDMENLPILRKSINL